jgi:hypothetical protein
MKKRAQTYLALAFTGLSLAMPAHAGFLDFLFEGSPPIGRYPGGQVYERERSPGVRDSYEVRRVKREAQRHEDQSDQQLVKINRSNIKKYQDIAKVEGVKAALLKDHTLRRGDILVTPKGLIVYDGRGGRFQPLEQSSLKNRPDLQNVAIALPDQ